MADQPEITAECLWETPKAARYMTQLCKHFSHRLEVRCDDREGFIGFEGGRCVLLASPEALLMRVTAEDQSRAEALQDVVVSHLQRFAFRDLTEEAAAALPWRPV